MAGVPGEDALVPQLLVVHHTPSPNLQALLEAVREGVALVEDVDLGVRPALSAGAADLLEAGGGLLGGAAHTRLIARGGQHLFGTLSFPPPQPPPRPPDRGPPPR